MSPTGHNVTAAAMGAAIGIPLAQQGLVLESALVMAGTMLGARAPDWTEMARWVDGKRYSIIPHRGPTHWPGVWIAGAIASALFVPAPYSLAFLMFCISALLHLLFDIMTPSGIPLAHPFARRRSVFVYRASNPLPETLLCVQAWLIALVVVVGWPLII
jgi:membrane-bound metal-dependent hydrolase YbcI (DUF457 family)